MAGTTSGNGIEDGREQELSLWREKVEHRIHIALKQLQFETDGFQILKVPEHSRIPPEMFTPVEWRFGLHNLKGVDTVSGSEALKLCVPVVFGLEAEQKWVKFCDDVVPEPKMMLACYGLNEDAIQLKEEDIKQILAFDALCIALKIDWDMSTGQRFLWRHASPLKDEFNRAFYSNVDMWGEIFCTDLSKVENQIPFDLLKRAIMHVLNFTNRGYEVDPLDQSREQFEADSYLENWMKEAVYHTARVFMAISDNFYADENFDQRLSESHHILDATYKVICGKNGLGREIELTQEDYIHIPSAMKLKHAGVKIKGEGGPLCNMSYNKETKVLILPKSMIYRFTIDVIRNMIQYEVYHVKVGNSMFRDYISLMVDLIDTPEDLEYLIQCGVFQNVSKSRALDQWKGANRGLLEGKSSKEHNDMKREIRRRCDQRLPKLWREFKILFCSRPWLIVPIIAATLLVAATLIQTYADVIGSNRMIPRFKNP